MAEITMPRLSDTMEEGTIARWLKQPGDEIKKGDILAEIETDKATMELEAYEGGTLQQILVQEGETVPIGQPVGSIGSGAVAAAPAKSEAAPKQAAAPVEGGGGGDGAQGTAEAPRPAQGETRGGEEGERGHSGVKASPLARRMAEEHSIDLSQVQGSGPGGRVVRDDIEDLLEKGIQAEPPPADAPEPAGQAPAAAPSGPAAQEAELVKLTRVQQLIARRLSESKQTIPHFYVSSEVDMTELLGLRQTLNANLGEGGVKVTVNDLIIKAAALALEKYPEINSSLKEDHFVRYKRINVGMAVDAPTGLVVPVVRDANSKGVRSIARETKALAAKARENKLGAPDLEGGTFSVSNLGMMDAATFIAVINPPQAAILAVAATRKQYVPVDGQPQIREMMTMTLSADHRIVSGATVARFLQEVKQLLQTPYSVLG
jgi:pyruvate dehydrogenase E2 component (dihydrolipoamide acetyltransferase)